MGKVVSIHEYCLRAGADPQAFEQALHSARESQILDLPGLSTFYFAKGIRGKRTNQYVAIWIYSDREAWEKLWGPIDQPKPKREYPSNWLVWEEKVLAPFLDRESDRIAFTAYEELSPHD